MTGTMWKCTSNHEYDEFIKFVSEQKSERKRLAFRILDQTKRTLPQNDMKELQVKIIADQVHGGDEDEARREAKYLCGVPILCRDDPEFKAFCALALKHLSHEERVKAMKHVPVTSRMSPGQCKEYIDKVFDKYAEQVDWSEVLYK